MRGLFLACGVSFALLFTSPGSVAAPNPAESLIIGGIAVSLEIAYTKEQRQRGLMYRRSLAPDSGMIFSFTPPRPVSMWMKNTLIDLDAAFVDACGRVTVISLMKAGTTDVHPSFGPVRWVIEMEGGWFAAHGLRPGLEIPALSDSGYCGRRN